MRLYERLLSRINSLLYSFKSNVIWLLYKLALVKVDNNRLIIRIDGGICSQMHFYLIGQLFAEKGYVVEYDLEWYDKSIHRTDVYARNFDLASAFPYLNFKKCSIIYSLIYKKRYCHYNDINDVLNDLKYMDLVPPAILTGYYRDPINIYSELFSKYFHYDESIFDLNNRRIYKGICNKENAIAIHVRRGDLANYNSFYGNPVSSKYFFEAINFMNSKYGECFFYFFSDEPNWVEQNLIPQLPLSGNFELLQNNGSDKGYIDLFLIAACRAQITSKGSFGKYGYILNQHEDKILIVSKDDQILNWGKYLSSVIVI